MVLTLVLELTLISRIMEGHAVLRTLCNGGLHASTPLEKVISFRSHLFGADDLVFRISSGADRRKPFCRTLVPLDYLGLGLVQLPVIVCLPTVILMD
jgi:hypothetical protein